MYLTGKKFGKKKIQNGNFVGIWNFEFLALHITILQKILHIFVQNVTTFEETLGTLNLRRIKLVAGLPRRRRRLDTVATNLYLLI